MTSPKVLATVAAGTRPGNPPISALRCNVIFSALVLGVLAAAIGQTVIAPALPTIVDDLGDAAHESWAITSYLLGGTVVVAVAGKFGDLFGRKRVLAGSIAIFLGGSVLCALSAAMDMLSIARALQGIGAGAFSVTASALVGEIFPLRERGRYQGILGAVFGVTTIAGPLLGGIFIDYLSWRWAFWINVPVSIVVLMVAVTAIPALPRQPQPVIDYGGIMVIALGTTTLIMAMSLGGTTYGWGSPTVVGLLLAAAVSLVVFVRVERRAAAAVLPPRLFRSGVFAVCCVLSFVVGFAMLGALIFIPIHLQYVDGASATASGLRTLPMVVGLLTTSIGAGILVGRTGRYKIFPVTGMALMTIAFLLMSRMDELTPSLLESLHLVILGAGIGLSMQTLVLIVQSTSRFEDLGVATSGVTFFRVIGAAFGAATFGALFANFLEERLGPALASSIAPHAAAHNPAALHHLPPEVAAPVVRAYADSLTQVFFGAAIIAAVGFILALLLREAPLTDIHDDASDLADGFAVPRTESPEDVLEAAVKRILHDAPGMRLNHLATQPDCALDVAGLWGVLRIYQYQRLFETARLTDIARHLHLPYQVLEPVFNRLIQTGYVARDGDTLSLTPSGLHQVESLSVLIHQWLIDHLAVTTGTEQAPEHHEFEAALQRVTDAVLVQRDWYGDLDAVAGSAGLAAAR
ncbi:Multidrug-efflux transporter 3 [Mycobacterium basiliense]|uniref:Multidrug-efflux transporter 3 n=1 Tax=Mycobacterium basiliense TaxID=2094119 RepID=A0A3S5CZT4_9MYCO|nr:MDR family MFS transporter [Mycobacterium basiliense]VDM88990.1 Multidrug-efflux transporter 3 [Mycobacterium basiliense]